MSISSSLPSDTQGYKFAGPAGKLPAGTQVGSTDYATTHVEGADAHDAPSTTKPLQVGGVAESTTPSAVADGDAVRAFFDTLGQLAVVLRGSTGAALLPNGAALADDVANPTLTQIASFLMAYDGSTWDRVRGTSANGVLVDVSRVGATALTMTQGNQSVTSTSGVVLASNGSRKYALLQNDGSVDCYLYFGGTATAGQGIRVPANGGYYEIAAGFGNLTTQAIHAVTASGSTTLMITTGS